MELLRLFLLPSFHWRGYPLCLGNNVWYLLLERDRYFLKTSSFAMSFPSILSGIYCIVLRIATVFRHPNVKWFFFSWERVWAWPSKITRGSIRHCWQSNIGLLLLKCCLSSAISLKTVAFHILKFCCHCWMLLIWGAASFLFRRASLSSNRWRSKEAEVDCWCATTEAVVLVSLYPCPYVSVFSFSGLYWM